MLDAYIINSIRHDGNERDDRRPHVIVEIDPPASDEVSPDDEAPEEPRGPVIIPLRPDEPDEEDDAA